MPCEEAILRGKGTDDDWGGPKDHVLHGGPDPPVCKGNFEGPLYSIGILCPELCKNVSTDRDAV